MNILYHIGRYTIFLKDTLAKPENNKMFWKELMRQINDIIVGSLPIVLIISFFVGAVSTMQTAFQLTNPLVSKTYVSLIVRDSIILELSPTLVCIVLAGVIGSKLSSELGNMRVSEQIDAIEIMGVNAKNYLVLPKLIACLLIIPLMIIVSMFVAILGGRISGQLSGLLSPEIFDVGLHINFKAYMIVVALLKSITFSFIISSVASYCGYHVKGGALEIGKGSTTTVVTACILILIADYIIAALFL